MGSRQQPGALVTQEPAAGQRDNQKIRGRTDLDGRPTVRRGLVDVAPRRRGQPIPEGRPLPDRIVRSRDDRRESGVQQILSEGPQGHRRRRYRRRLLVDRLRVPDARVRRRHR